MSINLRAAGTVTPLTLTVQAGPLVTAVSPICSFEKVEGGTRLDITDIDGTKSVILPDGATGPEGPQGEQGVQGPEGPQGVGIKRLWWNQYALTIELTNNTVYLSANLRGEKGEQGNDGATFTPHLASDGTLSWTNDGGRENPLTVNIKGPQGIQGNQGMPGLRGPGIVGVELQPDYTLKILYQDGGWDIVGPIRGPQGEQGNPGEDYVLTAQDKADIAGLVNVAGKADKVSSATSGNFAALDTNGNLTDSGKKPSDFVTGQALTNALSGKQNTLTFDTAPTDMSTNPVTSDGVYNGINNLKIDLESDIGLLQSTVDGHSDDIIDLSVNKQNQFRVKYVNGTDPTIQADSDHRYVCGTLNTLTVYPDGMGVTDVVFTSGTTPTVLNVIGPVKWPDWFDPTALEASTIYEINIMDGEFGVVGKWT